MSTGTAPYISSTPRRKGIQVNSVVDPFWFIRNGGKKIVNFTVTNFCNATCVYCSFHKQKKKKIVSFDEAKMAIDYLIEINTGVLSLTGGEPLLNPELPEIIKYARSKGLIVITGTNGRLLTKPLAKRLQDVELNAIWISYESNSREDFERNRGIPGLGKKIELGLKHLKDAGVNTFAIALINKSITDIPEFVQTLLDMGFNKVKFDYPINFELASTYKGWSDSPLLNYSGKEMENVISDILKVKTQSRIKVINPLGGLFGAVDFYNGRVPEFPCFAGQYILYLDADLDIYRCPALSEKLGSVGENIEFNCRVCNLCYYQGARDFGSFYYLLETLSLLRRGTWKNGAITGLRRIDLRLLRAVMDANDIRKSGVQ
jgi:MoaA/NifB/PqqE/SkfB family radical SAM enzyme